LFDLVAFPQFPLLNPVTQQIFCHSVRLKGKSRVKCIPSIEPFRGSKYVELIEPFKVLYRTFSSKIVETYQCLIATQTPDRVDMRFVSTSHFTGWKEAKNDWVWLTNPIPAIKRKLREQQLFIIKWPLKPCLHQTVHEHSIHLRLKLQDAG